MLTLVTLKSAPLAEAATKSAAATNRQQQIALTLKKQAASRQYPRSRWVFDLFLAPSYAMNSRLSSTFLAGLLIAINLLFMSCDNSNRLPEAIIRWEF